MSPLLNQQHMHSRVCNHYECSREDGKSNHIRPQAAIVEAKCAENRGTGDFYIEPILVVNQGEIFHLVDNESFETIVEY